MKNKKHNRLRWVFVSVFMMMTLCLPSVLGMSVMAERGVTFTVSPMKEKVMLNPGDEHNATVEIYIPDKYENDVKYKVEIAPFFVDENYNNDFTNTHGTNNEIVKWITVNVPMEGRLSPGETKVIPYTIKVPENAAGGGQYAAVLVSAEEWTDDESGTSSQDDDKIRPMVKEEKKIAQVIYAEVTGDVTKQGEITDVNVPGFMLSGNITGSASVKNTGNVHGEAKYKLQVFPLFSNEEIYTNEEDPQDRTILPGRTLYNETEWPDTPAIGIFNVVYTVEFEGVTAQSSKMVIKCPVWLLFIIIFVIMALIIWIVLRFRSRGKKNRRAATSGGAE